MPWSTCLGSILPKMTSASGSKSSGALPCLWSSAKSYPFEVEKTATVLCSCRPLPWRSLPSHSVNPGLLNILLLLLFISHGSSICRYQRTYLFFSALFMTLSSIAALNAQTGTRVLRMRGGASFSVRTWNFEKKFESSYALFQSLPAALHSTTWISLQIFTSLIYIWSNSEDSSLTCSVPFPLAYDVSVSHLNHTTSWQKDQKIAYSASGILSFFTLRMIPAYVMPISILVCRDFVSAHDHWLAPIRHPL